MSIYGYLNHIKFIKDFLEQRKNSYPKWTQRKLATLANIQAPYFSSALKGKVNFTQDQVYRIGHTIKLPREDLDFFMMISDYHQCSDKLRRDHLKGNIDKIRQKKERESGALGAAPPKENEAFYSKYYSDPLNKIVHVALAVKVIKENPKSLINHLKISELRLIAILNTLEELNIITVKKGKIEVIKKGFLLPKEHPLIYTHQTLLRQLSITQSANFTPDEKFSFSVTFTCEPKNLDQIKAKLLESLGEVRSDIIEPAKTKSVFQLNIDLFPWIK